MADRDRFATRALDESEPHVDMTIEFEDRDLAGAVFWGVDLRDARFRDVDFSGVRTQHIRLVDVGLDGSIDRLVVNGVDVTDFVNRHDPWQPLRSLLEPATADEVRRAWPAFTRAWDDLVADALSRPVVELSASVDGQWSFIETLRHLVFVADKWILGPLSDATWSPLGLPNTGSAGFPWPGIDLRCAPTVQEVLAARTAQTDAITSVAATLTDDRLDDEVEVLENGTVTVRDCWLTLLEESFEHRRYAVRDLGRLPS